MENEDSFLGGIFDRFANPEIQLFKDRQALHSKYVPKNLPFREKQMKQLANIVGVVIAGGTPSNAFLYGKTGVGKTVVARRVLNVLVQKAKELKKNVKVLYINCQIVDTMYRVYAHLCDGIGLDVPITGLPTDEIIRKFTTRLDSEEKHLLVILDEVDFLQKKNSKTLYGLTRLNLELLYSSMSIIGITNDVMFKQSIDPRVKSTLTEQEIVFFPYDSTQLRRIIKERVALGYHEGVMQDSAINIAAALAAAEHGDARRALDLIRVAGEIVESEKGSIVTHEYVKKALSVIEIDAISEVIGSLPLQSKILLTSIYFLDKTKKETEYLKTSSIYEKYQDLCKVLSIDILTQRRVGDLLNELDLLGMIKTAVISKGRYGRTRIITLSVGPVEIYRILSKDTTISHILE